MKTAPGQEESRGSVAPPFEHLLCGLEQVPAVKLELQQRYAEIVVHVRQAAGGLQLKSEAGIVHPVKFATS